jgi:hypothetical protein
MMNILIVHKLNFPRGQILAWPQSPREGIMALTLRLANLIHIPALWKAIEMSLRPGWFFGAALATLSPFACARGCWGRTSR